ncbi:IS5 family transposase [Pseudodonghicola xiamenensis]|uniref:IS5 family transposase n=1 Tax=Pseudodonghicola xiamenensis TaxID=337702 RepID=UPI000684141F|nr:IS5 family transposase [Pseudodonghicola xiamenensis]
MRGTDETSGSLFSYVDLEARIPARHPLRKIRQVVNDALASLDGEFEELYTDFGRPSIAPERLIRASLIQILFSIRSERQLMEQMDYNLLFRWFVGLGIDDPVWVPTVFSKNRDRLLTTDMSRKVMAAILAHREVAPLLSDDHFSVDGTLVKAWASMKSFQPKATDTPSDDDPGGPSGQDNPTEDHPEPTPSETDPMSRPTRQNRNAEVDFRGEKRSNATHASTTDPDARLYKKSPGTGAMLCFIGHALMENRNGLIVQGDLTQADGHAERRAALDMIHRHSPGSTRQLTLGADKGFDAAEFVADLRQACVTPHVAQKARYSAIDGRTTRHEGYALSIKHRKRIEDRLRHLGRDTGAIVVHP